MAIGGPETDVFAAADALLVRGKRPSEERVRQPGRRPARPKVGTPWPLAALMTGAWLRPFLEAWDSGLSVVEATFQANLVVERDYGSVPQYSWAMTVHGDFSLTKD